MATIVSDQLNTQLDLGHLILEDSSSFKDLTMPEFSTKTKANICILFKTLFERKKGQI